MELVKSKLAAGEFTVATTAYLDILKFIVSVVCIVCIIKRREH